MITAIALVFAAIGWLGEHFQVPEWVMFISFMAVFAIYDWAISHAWRLLVWVSRRSDKA